MDRLEELQARLAPLELSVRGNCLHDFNVDGLTVSGPMQVVLVGNLGGDFWPVFEQSDFSGDNALDRWTKHVLDPIADDLDATALYPNDEPYQPFQQWAMKAEGLKPSPLGILIHPEFGLWHAYRAAFLFSGEGRIDAFTARHHPCETCEEKPCLTTCPVGAFSQEGYSVPACVAHIKTDDGEHCATLGCLARQSCPVGREYTYSTMQQHFHMNAFVTRRG